MKKVHAGLYDVIATIPTGEKVLLGQFRVIGECSKEEASAIGRELCHYPYDFSYVSYRGWDDVFVKEAE